MHSQENSETVLAHVARNARAFRTALGLTQQDVAKRSGLSRRMIVALEAGDANISLAKLNQIATALGVSFSQIIEREAETFSSPLTNTTMWRGKSSGSHAVFLGATQATHEAELWFWSLEPGERYQAEADPQGYHEMVYVIEGLLHIEYNNTQLALKAGDFTIFDSTQSYAYFNAGDALLRFIRNVIS